MTLVKCVQRKLDIVGNYIIVLQSHCITFEKKCKNSLNISRKVLVAMTVSRV